MYNNPEYFKNLTIGPLSEFILGIGWIIEEWLDIDGYEDLYQVSSFGRFLSKEKYAGPFLRGKKILKQKKEIRGYLHISLRNGVKSKTFLSHRVVGIHFLENPNFFPEINHIFGDKSDNRFHKIEWVTASGNKKHAYQNGLMKQDGENHATKKLNWEKVREIRKLHAEGVNKYDLGDKFGVHFGHINNIVAGIFWKEKK